MSLKNLNRKFGGWQEERVTRNKSSDKILVPEKEIREMSLRRREQPCSAWKFWLS